MSQEFPYDPRRPYNPFASNPEPEPELAQGGSRMGEVAKMAALESMERAGKLNAEQKAKLAQLREAKLSAPWSEPAPSPPAPEPPPPQPPPQAPVDRGWDAAWDKQAASVADPDALLRPMREPFPFVRPTPQGWSQATQSATPPAPQPARGVTETVTDDMLDEVRRRIEARHNASSEVSVVGRIEAQQVVDERARQDETKAKMPIAQTHTPRFSSRSIRGPSEQLDNEPWMAKMSSAEALQDTAPLFLDPQTSPVKLYRALNVALGEEWVGWEWETIDTELMRAGAQCDPINRDKILACKLLVNSNEFYESWRGFSAVVTAFANRLVDWSYVSPLEPAYMAGAVAIARLIRPDGAPWAPEVQAFTAACCVQAGLVKMPPELMYASFEFARELLKRMGDEALRMQQRIDELVQSDQTPLQDEAEAVQIRRLLRIQYHVSAVLEEANR